MVEVEHLSKVFRLARHTKPEADGFGAGRLLEVVSDVSFSCQPGGVFCLVGPNGAGKATILRILATLLKPTTGCVRVCGFDTATHGREVRRRVGFLTGTTGLYERLTPEEFLRYYATLFGMTEAEFLRRRDWLYDLLGIGEFAHRRIGKLSSGMKQKVSIARTIIHDPRVVIFDEPTVGLDVITARAIIDFIGDCRNQGKTVIFSTHIMSEVSLLSDDLAVIHRGRLLFYGAFEQILGGMKRDSLEKEFIRILEEVP